MPPSSAPPAPSAVERRVILLVAMVQLVNVLDFVMVMPLGQDFARALGIDEARLGWIGGSYTLAAAVSGIVSARFLDRFDRRKALAVAMLGLVCATAAGGMAQDLPTMMAARIVAGMFGGPATSVSLAIIADVVPPERRGKAMGVVMASFSIASVLGVPAGLAAARAGSWRTPFFALAVIGLGVTFYAISRLPSLRIHLQGERPKSTPTLELLKRREMQLMLAAAGAMTFSIFMIVPYVRSFIVNNYGYPDDNVMFLYLVGGTGSFLVVQFTGRAVDRLGSTPVATLGTILVTACLLVGFLPSHPIVPVMVVFTLYMSTASLRGVPISTLSSRIPAPHERAQFMSMQSATQHISSSIGAIGAAQILETDPVDHRLLHMPVAVATACAVSVTVPFLLWQVERRVRARVAATAAAAPPLAAARNDEGAAEAAPIA